MGRLVFHDCDEFAESIVGVVGRFVPTARAASDWWVEAARVNSTTLQHSQIGGPATFAGDGEPETLTLGVPMTDPAALLIDGRALDQRSLVIVRTARPFTFTSRDVCRWVAITAACRSPFDIRADSRRRWLRSAPIGTYAFAPSCGG